MGERARPVGHVRARQGAARRCWQRRRAASLSMAVSLLVAAAGMRCAGAARLQTTDTVEPATGAPAAPPPPVGAAAPPSRAAAARTRVQAYGPLAPWARSVPPKSLPLPACMRLQGDQYGVGSALNFAMWGAAFMRAEAPNSTLFYDHTASHHTCSPLGTLDGLLAPCGALFRTGVPDVLPCVPVSTAFLMPLVQQYFYETWGGLISNGLGHPPGALDSLQQQARHHLLLDAALDALCPIVEDFLRLAPALQAQSDAIKAQLAGAAPVVSLHARGGDKETELGRFQNANGYYPMAAGMRALLARHPGLRAVPPVCVVVGDDAGYARAVARQARAVLGCSRVLLRAPREAGVAHDFQRFKSAPLAARCAEAKAYLVDIDLLAWSTFSVANHRANADTLALYLRKCRYHRDYRTAVPGTGGSHVNFWI